MKTKFKMIVLAIVAVMSMNSSKVYAAGSHHDYDVPREGEMLVYEKIGGKVYEYNKSRAKVDAEYKERGPVEVDSSTVDFPRNCDICTITEYKDGTKIEVAARLDELTNLVSYKTEDLYKDFIYNSYSEPSYGGTPFFDGKITFKVTDNDGEELMNVEANSNGNGESKVFSNPQSEEIIYELSNDITYMRSNKDNTGERYFNFGLRVYESQYELFDHVDEYGRMYDTSGYEIEYGHDDVIDVSGNTVGKVVCSAYASGDCEELGIKKGTYLGEVKVRDYPYYKCEQFYYTPAYPTPTYSTTTYYHIGEINASVKEIKSRSLYIGNDGKVLNFEENRYDYDCEDYAERYYGYAKAVVQDADGYEIGYLDEQGKAYSNDGEFIGYCKWYNFRVEDWPDDWTIKYSRGISNDKRQPTSKSYSELYVDEDGKWFDPGVYSVDAEYMNWLLATRNSNVRGEVYGKNYLLNLEPYEAEIVEEPYTDSCELHVKIKGRKFDNDSDLGICDINKSDIQDIIKNSEYGAKLDSLFNVKYKIYYYHHGKEYSLSSWNKECKITKLNEDGSMDLTLKLGELDEWNDYRVGPYKEYFIPEVGEKFKVDLEITYNDYLTCNYIDESGTIRKDNDNIIKFSDTVEIKKVNTTYGVKKIYDNYDYIKRLQSELNVRASFNLSKIRLDLSLKEGAKSEIKYINSANEFYMEYMRKYALTSNGLTYKPHVEAIHPNSNIFKKNDSVSIILNANPSSPYPHSDDRWDEYISSYKHNSLGYCYIYVNIYYGGRESEWDDIAHAYTEPYFLRLNLKAYYDTDGKLYRVEIVKPIVNGAKYIYGEPYISGPDYTLDERDPEKEAKRSNSTCNTWDSLFDYSGNYTFEDIPYNNDIINTPSSKADNIIPSSIVNLRKKAGVTGDKTTKSSLLQTMKLKSVKLNKKKKALTVTWKKQKKVESYDVYLATSKTGKYTKVATVKGSKTKATIKKLKGKKLNPKKTYWVTVVAHSTKGKASTKYKTYTTKNSGKKAYTIKKIKGLK